MSSDRLDPEIIRKFALTANPETNLMNAVRNLANRVNEHVLLLFAICKHLKTTPEALVMQLEDSDFVNTTVTPAEPESKIILPS